jgi:Xaa-Pro aminopeptidase/Xaa-Pro dipeptidase
VALNRAAWPSPDDFAPPPDVPRLAGWLEADRDARRARLRRLRDRFAAAGVDAYFGVRREHMRYLTGFTLADGEEKVAATSGQFLVGSEEVVLFADSRYTIQARREAPDARVEPVYQDLPTRWPELLASIEAKRVAVEAEFVPHAVWSRLAAAAPDVELVPIEGWLEADRAIKEPAEIERIAAACAVADRALATLLPEIRPGRSEADVALRLEWLMRTGGAEALAFDVACLAGPEAALPHGAPGDRPIREGAVLLFDFGAQVAGYRSDMTRTLFVGDPTPDDLEVYELVAAAQTAAIDALRASVVEPGPAPSGREIDALARAVIADAGREPFAHSLGHGIGLATHELPSLGRKAAATPLPSPTVFSVEPGIYVEGEIGVRIEDLLVFDRERRVVERLTQFPQEIVILG